MSDYSSNFPQQRPKLNLVFNSGSDKLDSRLSYTRSSSGTAFSAERHKSSENLVTQSDGSDWIFSSADYTKSASQAGPDGSTNATKFTEKANGSNQYRVRSQNFTPIANQEITYSVWLKETSGTRNYQQLRVGNIGANMAFATFNLTNGTVDQTGGTLGVSASVNAGPTGWYQCVLRFTPTSATALSFYIYAASASGGEIPLVTGDTGNSYTLFGAQVSTLGETVVNETSGQIHREFAPTLKTASADTPRFEYATDGQSDAGSPRGLLIESQSSNLFARSSGFDYTSAWTKTNVTATAEAISPDGTLNAFAIRENDGGGTKRIHQAATVSAGSVAVSVYAKLMGSERRLVIREDSTTGDSAVFDLSSGTVAATNAGGSGTIEDVGGGFFRCTLITSPSGSPGYQFGFWLATATGTNYENYTGDGYSGLILFGAMCENASASSSLISTSGSTATRSADSCSLVSAPLLDNGSGGLTVEYDMRNASTTSYALQTARTTGATNNDGVTIFNEGLFVNGAGSSTRIGSTTSNVFHKVAASWESGSQKISRDGSSVTEDTTTVVPQSGTDKLHIGTRQDGNASVNGHIRNIAIYSEPLTSTNLTTLSQL
jgi:hypothetical protein